MKRYIRGVGSGLPYVQQYMEGKGGSLSVEDNISGGTVVTISTRPADEAPVRSEAAAPAAQPQQQAPWPQPQQAPYGWGQPAAVAQPWQQAAAQPWPQAPQQQAPQQQVPYQAQPGAWGAPAQASQPPAAPAFPQVSLSERGRLALLLSLERGSVGPTDLVQAYGSSAATWSRELSSLAALGAVLKAGQKYRPTEYGRAPRRASLMPVINNRYTRSRCFQQTRMWDPWNSPSNQTPRPCGRTRSTFSPPRRRCPSPCSPCSATAPPRAWRAGSCGSRPPCASCSRPSPRTPPWSRSASRRPPSSP